MSKNVFHFITDNFVLSEKCNHFSYTIVYMSVSATEFYPITQINCNQTLQSTCIWSKATKKDHKNEVDLLCNCIIESCVVSGLHCIPLTRSGGRGMPGYTEQVKPERKRSLFWHWM